MNKLYIVLTIIIISFFSINSYGQEIEAEEAPKVAPEIQKRDSNEIFVFVEDSPDFPGGIDSLFAFIHRVRIYPQEAQDSSIQGTVYVSFVVEKDGSLSDIKIIRGVCPSLNAEALRVMKMMPKWKPGKQRGKPVRVKFNMPIAFRLQG
jgi:periplasmic protein TonB